MSTTLHWLTCVGSRATPMPYCRVMTKLGTAFARRGAGIRSGNAIGADQAWERGAWDAGGPVESYTVKSKHGVDCIPLNALPSTVVKEARSIAQLHYPWWPRAKEYTRDLMTRNVFQVLGQDLAHPADALLCWAEMPVIREGRVVDVAGGTGLAVRLATTHHIPVLNIQIASHLNVARNWYRNERAPIDALVHRIKHEIPVAFDS